MDCKNLMVGDWVSYCGFYNKVIYIGQKVSMYNGKGTEFTTDPEYIRPIPLTEEILVKNGWFALDEYRYEGDVALAKESSGFRLKNTDICVKSVHQLQHLLRLCGIEKELIID